MLPNATPLDWAWVDVAVPRRADRLPGISMAGFRHRSPALVDIAMVAHPAVTVVVDLNEGSSIRYDVQGRQERGSVVVGLLPGRFRAAGWGVGECLQIRLEPVAAAAVLGGATAELNGTVVSLEDVWGRDVRRFEDRLRAASWDERFTIVAEILGRRLGARAPVDPEVARTWRRTLTSRGRVRVDGLADEVGWSRKRLWSRFRSQLGITPKRAAQLVRFDHAAHLLAAGHAPASAAIESGYADQSHLHREVMAFTGLTPTALAAAPWLAIDDIAWPAAHSATTRAIGDGHDRAGVAAVPRRGGRHRLGGTAPRRDGRLPAGGATHRAGPGGLGDGPGTRSPVAREQAEQRVAAAGRAAVLGRSVQP